jgi:hypothetical protein
MTKHGEKRIHNGKVEVYNAYAWKSYQRINCIESDWSMTYKEKGVWVDAVYNRGKWI